MVEHKVYVNINWYSVPAKLKEDAINDMKEHLDNKDVTDTDIITILDVCEDIVKSKDEDFVALSITTSDDTEVYDQGTDGDYFHVYGYTEA